MGGSTTVTAFDRCADSYVAGRPGYPDATLEFIRSTVDRAAQPTVLDLGAGTGILTRQLVAAGLRVVAVDRSAAMLAQADRSLPRAVADATALPIRSGSCGACVAATAFHWFATPAAVAEIRRVLDPRHGRLVLVWNVPDERDPLVRQHRALTRPFSGGIPRFESLEWKRVLEAGAQFEPLAEHTADNPVSMDAERLVARTLSTSFVAALPPSTRTELAAKVRELVSGVDGPFAYPYVTRSFVYGVR